MSYITISTEKNETYSSISNLFIDYYMTHANGEFVKVYLYLVRLMSFKAPVSVADIADHFNLTEKDICRAIKYWITQDVMKLNYNQAGELTGITLLPLKEKKNDTDILSRDNIALFKMPEDKASNDVKIESPTKASDNLMHQGAANHVSFQTELPKKETFSPALAAKFKHDEAFSDIIFEVETYFGKNLSAKDMETLIYIYDSLNFSSELMEYLIEYCVTLNKKSMRYAESVANSWYQQGIHTKDEAKEAGRKYNPLYRSIFKQLGINRMEPTSIETAYIETWNKDMGFELNIILEACKKAVIAKPNSANFAYVNGILENWYKNGVKSIRDIDKLDREYANQKSQARGQAAKVMTKPNSFGAFASRDMGDELDEMEQLFLNEINSK
ncbi:MAG: DnaD domain protein [Coprococcus sp.]|nr:DnaD domain protein [Coprococcus sp.]